jgi:hypothetical protein
MGPLDLVQLSALRDRTNGRPEISIGLIDGPVALNQPDLVDAKLHEVPGSLRGTLWSEFPAARADEVKLAITRCGRQSRNTIVPPLLDAWGAYETISRR